MRGVGERSGSEFEMYQRMGEKWGTDLRVALPCIVDSFDPVSQTITAQPAIKERIIDQGGNISMVDIPLLLDVPIVLPRAGGYALTFPIAKGDECLVVFGDMCMDAWWAQGGAQMQSEQRRHDLSDGFAIMGVWSQPRILANYSNTMVQLRTDNGSQRIEISQSSINLVGTILKNGVAL